MLPGAAFLQSGGYDRYRRDRALRFFLLKSFLDEAGGEAGRLARQSTALQTAGARTAAQIVENGSSFFWFYADLLYQAFSRGQPIPEHHLQLFLVQLMDCLFSVLEDSDSVVITDSIADVVLPVLGVRVRGTAGAKHLVRRSAGELELVGERETLTIDLRVPGDHTLPGLSLRRGARLLTGIESLLDDALAQQQIADLSADGLTEFGHLLNEALDLIERMDPTLAEQIHGIVKWYFPIQTPDKRHVHNSFTIAGLNGAAFLSESYSFLPLAEALVHEYYHTELWMAMKVDKHLADSGEEVLYSPWRPDARPLQGLYHAVYVFTGLLEFYLAGERQPDEKNHHAHFRARRRAIYHQLRTGLQQIRRGDLRPPAADCVAGLSEIVQRHGEELGLTDNPVPDKQRRHWHQWTTQYPHLRERAVCPLGAEGGR